MYRRVQQNYLKDLIDKFNYTIVVIFKLLKHFFNHA
jgi:hypothetical protein